MSAAWPACPVVGVSTITGTPAVAGWAQQLGEGGLAQLPAPIVSCRSRSEPHASGSRWRAPARAGPARPWRPARPGSRSCRPALARSCPAAQAWQVSKQTPSHGCQSTAVEVRAEILHPGGQAAPAAGARLDQQPRPAGRGGRVEQRQQRLADLAQGGRGVPVVDRRAGVEDHRPGPDRRRRGAARGPASRPSARTVAAVGEPRFTSSEACTYDGDRRARRSPATNASSWAGSPSLRAQPRGLETKTCTAVAAGCVHVGQRGLGQPARGRRVRPDQPGGPAERSESASDLDALARGYALVRVRALRLDGAELLARWRCPAPRPGGPAPRRAARPPSWQLRADDAGHRGARWAVGDDQRRPCSPAAVGMPCPPGGFCSSTVSLGWVASSLDRHLRR